jgi:dTDP-4-dehydrorhamnose reductase
LDLAAPGDWNALFTRYAPDVIVSAAAYTAVDRAEQESEAAFAINARGAAAVAQAAAALKCPIIHLSTDYVFDGSGNRPLRETDPTGPLGIYGSSKREGEVAVAQTTPDHAILRTAWIYAAQGNNFVRAMLRLAATRDGVRVVSDQLGTPTSASAIAASIEKIARNLVADHENQTLRGIFHLSATGGPVSWATFAMEIFKLSAERGGPAAGVAPIPSSEYPTPAKRPHWSLLDTSKIEKVHGVYMRDWKAELTTVLDQISAEGAWA